MIHLVDTVNGHSLYRGPRPSSFEEFEALKCKTVTNLEAGWFELLHQRSYQEDGWAEACDVILEHIPLSDFCPPTRAQVDKFINSVKLALTTGDHYFHCLYGVDRTGYMAAAYRIIVQGWTSDAAIKEMLDMGFHKFPYYFWIASLRELKNDQSE